MIGEKRDRDPEEVSEKEPDYPDEDEDEEEEDTYEFGDFVVPDEEVEEVDEEPPKPREPKPKKTKVRSRLKKAEQDDEGLIDNYHAIRARTAEELAMKLFPEGPSGEEPQKRQKVVSERSVSSEHSEISESEGEREGLRPGQFVNMEAVNLAAQIFGHTQTETAQQELSKDVFEPAERKERFATKEDEEVRDLDIPERLQYRLNRRYSPEHSELQAEANWLCMKFMLHYPGRQADELKAAILAFLEYYRVEKFEVPFIWKYRIHYLSPSIDSEAQLWDLYHWDGEWGYIFESKMHYNTVLKKAEANFLETELEAGSLVLAVEKIPEQVLEILETTSPEDYRFEIDDLKKFTEVYTYPHNYSSKKNTSSFLQQQRNSLKEFIIKLGMTPVQFSENLKHSQEYHNIENHNVRPKDLAFDLLSNEFLEELQVLEAACGLLKKEISSLPYFRKFLRTEYVKYTYLFTSPTEQGKEVLDVFHPQYRVKNLEKGKLLEYVTADFWADILKAESSNWIQVEFKQVWGEESQDRIFAQIVPFFTTVEVENEVAEEWNHYRELVLEKALEEMYSVLESEWRNEMNVRAEEHILFRAKSAFSEILNKTPYRVVEEEDIKPKVFSLVTDPHVDFYGKTGLIVLNSQGEVLEACSFNTLSLRNPNNLSDNDRKRHQADKRVVERMMLDYHPELVVVGANCLNSVQVRKFMATLAENLTQNNYFEGFTDWNIDSKMLLSASPPVVMCDMSVPKLFSASQRAKRLFPEYDFLMLQALSAGRYMQCPLAETLGLNSDPHEKLLTNLNLDPLQKLVNQKRLEHSLECMAVSVSNEQGADINQMIEHWHLRPPLDYIAGLGPVKAHSLIEKISQKCKGRLPMRITLLAKHLVTQRVFENCSGFILIPAQEDTDPLDATRIHPEFYELAKTVAASALDYTEDHQFYEMVVHKAMKNPHVLEDLDLEAYAKRLEERNQPNMKYVLDFIVKEISAPFKVQRKGFSEPSPEEVLYMVTGETPQTLTKGSLVPVTIVNYDKQRNFLRCKLECGLDGICEARNIIAGREPTVEEISCFKKGVSMTARVTEVSGKYAGADLFFRIKLSVLDQDVSSHENFVNIELDEGFVVDENDWTDKMQVEDDSARQGQKYVPRKVNHPRFKNIGLHMAQELLRGKDIGECIFRPSARGVDHLTCTWKFYDYVYSHLDITEEGKPAPNMLGSRFKIGSEAYDSLQEIIDRYILPCEKLTKEAIIHPKFKDCLSGRLTYLENTLKQEKRNSPKSIPYYFTIVPEYPQYLVLCYIPKEKVIQEYIKVKPHGLFFHEAYHTNMNFLISWFKRHSSEKTYQQYLSKSKPPVMDTSSHFAVPPKLDMPRTPIHRMQTPTRDSTPFDFTPHITAQEWQGSTPISSTPFASDPNFQQNYNRNERKDYRKKPQKRTCHTCGSEDHLQKDCTQRDSKKPIKCYNCNEFGHIAARCDQKKQPREHSPRRKQGSPGWGGEGSPGWSSQPATSGWGGQSSPGWSNQPAGWGGQSSSGWSGQPAASDWGGQGSPGWSGQPAASGWGGQGSPGWSGQQRKEQLGWDQPKQKEKPQTPTEWSQGGWGSQSPWGQEGSKGWD